MNDKPQPGTYGALQRSTEDEHQAFMAALRGLCFTRDEFIARGPMVVLEKGFAVLDRLRAMNDHAL